MNKKILGLILLAGLIVMPVVVLGQVVPDGGSGASNTATQIAQNIMTLALTIGTVIVVIGWIIAGILYLTAMGDPAKLKIAKGAMVAALIGTALVVVGKMSYPVIEGIIKSVIESGV